MTTSMEREVRPGPLTPERRRALTREALLDSAATVFAQRGYEAGTLEEIAVAAGFTTGAIYSNFGSKQELFLALLDRRNERLTEDYAGLLDRPVTLSQVAELWAQRELADRDSLRLLLEFRLAALRDPQIGERLAGFERRTEEALGRFVAEHLTEPTEANEGAISVTDFAVVVHAASHGIWQHIAICGSDHSNLFEAFLALVTHGLEQGTST